MAKSASSIDSKGSNDATPEVQSPAPGLLKRPPPTPLEAGKQLRMTSTPPTTAPRRGGINHFGVFIGGSPLDIEYRMISPKLAYKHVSQLRVLKQLQDNQKSLLHAKDSAMTLKFNGKLEIEDESSKELDKDQFIDHLKNKMRYYGLQTWFYLPSVNDDMCLLLDESHLFTVAQVIENYNMRMLEPPALYDSEGDETVASIKRRHIAYDEYEHWDIGTSRLAVESLVSPALLDRVAIRNSHMKDFTEYPGGILFMMILDTCNASATIDIDGAKEAFQELTLESFPGENVEALATKSLKLIKIMKTGYALDMKTGSKLLHKVESTSTPFFNRSVHAKLDTVLEMERDYALRDPKSLELDPRYNSLGPIPLCGFIREKYNHLVTDKMWIALTSSPSANNAGTETRNSGGRVCFACQSAFHMKGDRACPNYNQVYVDPRTSRPGGDGNQTQTGGENGRGRAGNGNGGNGNGNSNGGNGNSNGNGGNGNNNSNGSGGNGTSNGGNGNSNGGNGNSNGNDSGNSNQNRYGSKAGWKYAKPHPDNENTALVVNEVSWWWCGKCKCVSSGKVGYYNKEHTTANHPTVAADGNTNNAGVNDFIDMALPPPILPSTNPEETAPDEPLLHDDNALEMDGGWVASCEWNNHSHEENQDYLNQALDDLPSDHSTTSTNSGVRTPEIEFGLCQFCDNIGMVYNKCSCEGIFFPFQNGDLQSSSDESENQSTSSKDEVAIEVADTLAGLDLNSSEPSIENTSSEANLNIESKPYFLVSFDDAFFDCIDDIEEHSNIDTPEFYFDCTSTIDPAPASSIHPVHPLLPLIICWSALLSALPAIHFGFQCIYSIQSIHNCIHPYLPAFDTIPAFSYAKGVHFTLSSINNFMTSVSLDPIYALCICVSSLFWDTASLFRDAPASPRSFLHSRKFRRQGPCHHSSFLRSYPTRWLILSCLCVVGSRGAQHPATIISHQLHSTLQRSVSLCTMIDASPSLCIQYNRYRFNEFSPATVPSEEPTDEPHEDLSEYLDCLDTIHEIEGEETVSTTSQTEFHDCIDIPGFEPLLSLLSFALSPTVTIITPRPSGLEVPFLDCYTEPPDDDIFFESTAGENWPGWIELGFFDWTSDCLKDTYLVNCVPKTSTALELATISPSAYHAIATTTINPVSVSTCFPVIFDSGASKAISGNLDDFAGPITPAPPNLTLGGMANGMKIEGEGTIEWSFYDGTNTVIVRTQCYYVPQAKVRLLSPQRLFNKNQGTGGVFMVDEYKATLKFDNTPSLSIPLDSRNYLPIGVGRNASMMGPQSNLSIADDENQNLTPSQKLLLHWHDRWGHMGLQKVQRILRVFPFASEKFLSASRCTLPKCTICEYSKGHRLHTSGNRATTNPTTDGALRANSLSPGHKISVDHFESRLRGRTYTSFGKTTSEQYVGGCIFVDQMSSYIHVQHQLGFSSSETIRAKQNYEQMCLDNGILVESYMGDNGVFKAKAFVKHIRDHNQQVHYCGVNAHHQNSVAERSIRTVSEIARSMILHSSMRWKNGIDASLWPMAVDYACHVYNHLPNAQGIAPADLFTGSTVPRHKLKDLHVFGCPVYVLDPKLQQGKKLPRWQPRSRRGIFVGYSPHHSSDVPLVLNLQTGSISPQYHVVFDDTFSTVISVSESEEPPEFWTEILLDDFRYRIPLDDDVNPELNDDWLTPPELEEKNRRLVRRQKIRSTFTQSTTLPAVTDHPNPTPTIPAPVNPPVSSPSSEPAPSPTTAPIPVSTPDPTPAPEPLRRSARATKGTWSSSRYINEVFLTCVLAPTLSSQEQALAYHAELSTDYDHGLLNCHDPRAYAAQTLTTSSDNPSYTEATTGSHAPEYIAAMKTEINQLLRQRTWERVDRSAVPPGPDGTKRKILPGTWAFKLKRLPDGTPLKFKARYCVRGDLQTEGVDYFDTYAPVVQWATVRMVLSLILTNGWSTKQVDYTNAFAQADLAEEVYIEPPRGFSGVKDKTTKVLKLLKSLYGLKQAPRTFYQKLKTGLEERGFTMSEHDACLFMKKDIICVVYVDDTILCGPNAEDIEREIKSLGVSDDEHRHSFQLRDEGEVGDFLGIRIAKGKEGEFTLTQTGLINKVLKTAEMENCKPVSTPAVPTTLGIDKDGDAFNESWEYASIVGMLMYLANNSRPDIAFAVHQCARFTHCPRNSHAIAIKRILRYLKGTNTQGMSFCPNNDYQVDCYVDADFAGLYGSEHDQDPICVKSRTGYLITFMGCPLLWVSKLQTQIALSTMEAEYIALSQSMRDLIPIRETIKEIKGIVFSGKGKDLTINSHSKTFIEIPQSIVHEDNAACLKFANLPKMSPRTKHIAIPYHFFRTKVQDLSIRIVAIGTDNQLGDQFTKGLVEVKFVRDRKRLMGW